MALHFHRLQLEMWQIMQQVVGCNFALLWWKAKGRSVYIFIFIDYNSRRGELYDKS